MNANERLIRVVVAALSPGASPNVLLSTAKRESAFVADAKRINKDGEGDVFLRDREKLKAAGNPYTGDEYFDDWAGSWGLYQLMAPYETQRWRADAHPSVLFNPIISTILAMRKVNRIIDLGAKNALDVRMVWAFGPKGLNIAHDNVEYTKRLASETKRWQEMGLPGSPLDPIRKFDGVGTGPSAGQQAQLERLNAILGGTLPDSTTTNDGGSVSPVRRPSILPLVAVAGGGVLAYFAWQTWQKSASVRRLTTS